MFNISLLLVLLFSTELRARTELRVGSKSFTEGVILGEIIKFTLENSGFSVKHKQSLGGTEILWEALRRGDIDVYAEYEGTIIQEILKKDVRKNKSWPLEKILDGYGVKLGPSLGFRNAYALAMKEDRADSLHIRKISDLLAHPDLQFVFSDGFMGRADGWSELRKTYALKQERVRVMDHSLAYRGLINSAFDLTDVYTTDAELSLHPLRILEDDFKFFPTYDALLLYRKPLENNPSFIQALNRLENKISETEMSRMNADVLLNKNTEQTVALHFVQKFFGKRDVFLASNAFREFIRQTYEHLYLVLLSMFLGFLTALPLGILASRKRRFGALILATVGTLQTIPSLALLVFMIPLFGIGTTPAVMALFLYSLLPMVRNTCAGLEDIPRSLIESAEVIGLSPFNRLWRIELPLASRTILAGLKTAFVINVGTATLGALIGAGGYGEAILAGIRLNDLTLTLQGAIPAALMALGVQGLFTLLDKIFIRNF